MNYLQTTHAELGEVEIDNELVLHIFSKLAFENKTIHDELCNLIQREIIDHDSIEILTL